ncbi:diguanylate cyclase domain-containing protein [Ilumatobacter sp.]|uniref:diguanylate cyclase domain-containing protein n=1 Tax=Ilumatobacter sp. TaxID=1967498 RepID=UPI003B5256F5
MRLVGAGGAAVAITTVPSGDALLGRAVALALIAVSTTVATVTALTDVVGSRSPSSVIGGHVACDLTNMLVTIAVIDPTCSTGAWTLVLVPIGEAALLAFDRRVAVGAVVAAIGGLFVLIMSASGPSWSSAGSWALVVFLAGGPMSVFLVQAVRVQEALFQSRAARRSLHEMATHDELTGLLNRRGLLEHAAASSMPAAVLFVDLDRFKTVNDTLGHDAGDIVLRTVASRMADVAGDDAVVARLGGDEFAVVVSDADAVATLPALIVSACAEAIVVRGVDARIGASVGSAVAGTDGDDLLSLIDHADSEMYARKARTRPSADAPIERRAARPVDDVVAARS